MQQAFAKAPVTLKEAAIRDTRSEPFPQPVKKSLMTKLDEKAAQQVTISRGTVWLIATGLVLATVIFNYGASMVGWVREDQSSRERLNQIQTNLDRIDKRQEDMDRKFDEIQKTLQQQALKDAEKRGYELGAVDGKSGHAK